MIEPRIIRRAEDCDSVLTALRQAVLAHLRDNDRPLAVWLRSYSAPRNNEQNARLQWLCRLHAGWLNARRMELIAEGKLPSYFPPLDVDLVRHQIFNPQYGQTSSSARLNKMAMAEALTRYEADLQNLGVEIPETFPGEAQW